MNLSVIICTWNNAPRLKNTLRSIMRCEIPYNLEWELIIVNNNCTDNTDEVIDLFINNLPITYLYEQKQGPSHARNAGLKVATGQLVIFTDDDVQPNPKWIISYWKAFLQKPEGYFFGGPIESIFESGKPNPELLTVAPYSVKGMNWGNYAKILNPSEIFVAANLACPSNVLKKIGGFDPRFGAGLTTGKDRTGEENDLIERLKEAGLLPYYLPETKIAHFVSTLKISIAHIQRRRKASGYYYGIKNKNKYASHIKFFGIPLGLYKKIIILCLIWCYKRIQGMKGYQQYLQIFHIIGIIEGIKAKSDSD